MTKYLLAILLLMPTLSHSREIQLICDGESSINGESASLAEDRWVLNVVIHEDKEKAAWSNHPAYIAASKARRSQNFAVGVTGTGHFETEQGIIYPFTKVSERAYEHLVIKSYDDGRANRVSSSLELDRFNLHFDYGRLVGDQYWRTQGVCSERGRPRI